MKKVCIIGSGVSGLSCAYHLTRDADCEVTIVEALDRIGGKIYDIAVDDATISVGGLLVMNWYKNTKQLLTDLNLELISIPKTKRNKATLIARNGNFERIAVLKNIAPLLNLGIHAIALKSHKDNLLYEIETNSPEISTYEFLNKIGAKKLINDFNLLFNALGYSDIDSLPSSVFVELLRKSILSGTPPISYIKGGPMSLINSLKNNLSNKKVTFLLNTPVTEVQHDVKTVRSSNGCIEYDYLVSTVPGSRAKSIFNNVYPDFPTINYTQMFTAVIKSTRPLMPISETDSGAWCRIFFDRNLHTYPDLEVKLVVAEESSSQIYTVYIFNNSSKKFADVEAAKALIEKWARRNFNDPGYIDFIEIVNWHNMMPNIDYEAHNKLMQINTLNNIYFAGDFIGFPCIESSLTQGKNIAKVIASKITNEAVVM